jgi:hypothetical protein
MSIKKKTHTFYQLGGHILEQVDSNPYLGLQISEDLKWSESLTDDLTASGRSFMWQRNSMRQSTVPCGTPESTVTCWDDSPSNVTLIFFFVRKFVSHCSRKLSASISNISTMQAIRTHHL